MLQDLGWLRQIKIEDIDGNLINPATREKLDELKVWLQSIDANTDTLEDKIQATNDTLGIESGATVLSRLLDIWNKLTSLFADGLAKIKLWDGTNTATFTETGRLLVSAETPPAPPGQTSVKVSEYGLVTGVSDKVTVIPNGELLRLVQFGAGAEVDTVAGNVVELFYDPNGDGSVLEIIAPAFVSGNSHVCDLSAEYEGNGSRAIRLRRRRLSGGAKEVFGCWKGYY